MTSPFENLSLYMTEGDASQIDNIMLPYMGQSLGAGDVLLH